MKLTVAESLLVYKALIDAATRYREQAQSTSLSLDERIELLEKSIQCLNLINRIEESQKP